METIMKIRFCYFEKCLILVYIILKNVIKYMEKKKNVKKDFRILFKSLNEFDHEKYNQKMNRFVYIHISYTFFVDKISELISTKELNRILDIDIENLLLNKDHLDIEKIKEEILINKIKENVKSNIDTFLNKNGISREEFIHYLILLDHIIDIMNN